MYGLLDSLVGLGEIKPNGLLKEKGLPIPPRNGNPKIIIQNEKKLAVA